MTKRLTIIIALMLCAGFIRAQGLETFANFTATGSSYSNGSFTGQDGSDWSYIQARGDTDVDGKALMLGKNRSPQSQLESGLISGGIGTLSFAYQQAFSTDVNLLVLINGTTAGSVTSSSQPGTPLQSPEFQVNVAGDFTFTFINADNSDGQVVIDNILWTAYDSSTPEPSLSVSTTGLNGFSYSQGQGPSAAQSFTLSGTDLIGAVQLSAPAAFELSLPSDANYQDSLLLNPSASTLPLTTVYVRLKAALPAAYYENQILTLSTPGATDQELLLSGEVTQPSSEDGYFIDFENESKGSYASGNVNLNGLNWNMTEALIGTLANDFKNGDKSARLRGYGSSAMTMLEDKSTGLGTLSFYYRRYGSDNQVAWKVERSIDQAQSWQQIGADFTAPASDIVQIFSEQVNLNGNVRIRIRSASDAGSSDARLNIDDILLTDFSGQTPAQISVYPQALDAFVYLQGSGPSPSQSFTVSGAFLTSALVISAAASYEISLSSNSNFSSQISLSPSSGMLPATQIYVRLKGNLSIGSYAEDLEISSPGAPTQYVSLSGEVLTVQLPQAPLALEATGVTPSSFVANWQAATGATSYRLDVYTTAAPPSSATDLFFSEYVEGSSNNKALEIFNGTGNTVNLSDYRVHLYSNGSFSPTNLQLSGTLVHGEVFTLVHSSATSAFLSLADYSNNGGVLGFNGNDALALYKVSTQSYVDIFGVIGDDPGAAWTVDSITTVDRTLVRKPFITEGVSQNPTGTGPQAFTTLAAEWEGYPMDYSGNFGYHNLSRRELSYVPGYEDLDVGFVTSYTVSGLQPDTDYYYRLRAVNSQGISEDSNAIEVFTQSVSAPTVQASHIEASIARSSINLEWTVGNGARRIVVMNTSNYFSTPADGTDPAANPIYNGVGQQVVYNDATQFIEDLPYNGVLVENLEPATTYYFRVFEYNGSGSQSLYLNSTATGNPAAFTTLDNPYTGYYTDISGFGDDLKSDLHDLLRTTHSTEYSYDALWTQLRYTDEDPNNSNNIIQIYTGWSIPKSSNGGGITQWNREHTWSKSHGGFGESRPAGTDLHHMRPCDATVNSAKGNKDFDEGGNLYVDASPYPGYSGNTGNYSSTYSWEPRDEEKGDVARMIMYMALRYEGTDTSFDLEVVDYVNSSPSGQPYYGKLSTLLRWHEEDPPDAWEDRRNQRIWERQGNRNPFIDHPEFAYMLWTPYPQSATNLQTDSFTAHWSAPITGESYWLQVATDSLFTSPVSGYSSYNAGIATNKAISGLSAGTTYYYRLRTNFGSNYSIYSPFMRVTTMDIPEPVSTTLSISVTGGQLLLDITPVPTALGYKIYASDNPYTGFSDVSAEGVFTGIQWSCAVADLPRRFYKAYAVWE
ncbi:MAG: endonuclease [Candidatus Cloacimonetes bacterium]|nr:endonuclease [Candidatus Cloacimonadota bacterium]